MNRREIVAQALDDCARRLDAVVGPWGFVFLSDGVNPSHTGPYACGRFVRGETQIGLACRDEIDNIFYEHSFITRYPAWSAVERFSLGHISLIEALGHAADSHVIRHGKPEHALARIEGDPIADLIYDLSSFVAPVLHRPSEQFFSIIRRGSRSFSVAS